MISKNNQILKIQYWNGRYGVIAENQNLVIPISKKITKCWGFNSYKAAEEFINKYLKKINNLCLF